VDDAGVAGVCEQRGLLRDGRRRVVTVADPVGDADAVRGVVAVNDAVGHGDFIAIPHSIEISFRHDDKVADDLTDCDSVDLAISDAVSDRRDVTV
jgi:hypothetical protein